MKTKVQISHKNLEEFKESLEMYSMQATCIEEGFDADIYEFEFPTSTYLFYFAQAYGLKIGYKITKDAYS
jgi:hypothetical protein